MDFITFKLTTYFFHNKLFVVLSVFNFRELKQNQDSYLKTLAAKLCEEYNNQSYEQIVMSVKKSMEITTEVN